ncbi:MFS transporter [Roseicyclus mahoneyensis]|uniref:Putative MFS family arabinose efflux permease n=1 Tax=Roseicyclus mahoneyensis TaxID=164332 RepID=A0A316GGY1_9RHOB|nr:MFS transporter [Roseicyclus mahoneyensis]PWK60282.1 putative MFS family arabinose efflux permease [Roseicyclus mahoneyensis]
MTLHTPLPERAHARWSDLLRDTPAFGLILVTVAGHMALFGMLTPVMATHAQGFGVPGWQIGLMITMFAVGRLAADLPAGFLADRIGLRVLLWGGPALCGIGGLIGGLAVDYPTILTGRLVQGVGSGLYMTAATIYVARMSDRRNRGKLMALFQGAMLVGASFGPVLGGWAAAAMGASGPFLAGAVIGLATAVIAALFFRDAPRGAAAGHGHHMPAALFLSIPFLSVLAINLGVFLTRTVGQWQILPLLAQERFAAGPDQIGLAITLSALGTLAVLPFAAWLIERVPRVTLITASLLATAACLAAIVLAGTMGWLMVAMVAMGLATGISGPAIAAYAVEITAPELHGPAMGAMRFAGDLGYLVGPVSFGLAIDLTGIGQSGGMALNVGLVAVLAVLFLAAHRRARPALT